MVKVRVSNIARVPTDVVLVIALVITHQSTLVVPISSIFAYYHTQDNISGIRAHAIEITLIFKILFGWKNDIISYIPLTPFCLECAG